MCCQKHNVDEMYYYIAIIIQKSDTQACAIRYV